MADLTLLSCPDCSIHGHPGFRDEESCEPCPTCGGDGAVCPHCGTGVCASATAGSHLTCSFTGKRIPNV
jgi:hypothetical protein